MESIADNKARYERHRHLRQQREPRVLHDRAAESWSGFQLLLAGLADSVLGMLPIPTGDFHFGPDDSAKTAGFLTAIFLTPLKAGTALAAQIGTTTLKTIRAAAAAARAAKAARAAGTIASRAGMSDAAAAARSGERGVRVAGQVPGALAPPQFVILDTNAVIRYKEAARLIRVGESPVVTKTVLAELRGLVVRGQIKGMPRVASNLHMVAETGSPQLRIAIRSLLEKGPRLDKGAMFADGVIGATALDRGVPMITFDAYFGHAVRTLGGIVRR